MIGLRIPLGKEDFPFNRRILAAVTLAALATVAAAITVCSLQPDDERQAGVADGWSDLDLPPDTYRLVELTPTKEDAVGVDPTSEFLLTTSLHVDEAALREGLRIEPAVAFAVAQSKEGEFRLTPERPLAEETVYRFQLALPEAGENGLSHSWAFQTTTPLRVVQSLPRDASTEVPVNTGIELTFSHDGVTDISQYFQIEPRVVGRFEVHKRVIVFVPEALQAGTLYTVTVNKGVAVEGSDLAMAQDFSFQFETGGQRRSGDTPLAEDGLSFSRKVNEWSTVDSPALFLYSGNPRYSEESLSESARPSLSVNVYAYPSFDAFVADVRRFEDIPDWAQRSRDSFRVDPSTLTPVQEFEAVAELMDPYRLFIRFPTPLAPGQYLVEVSREGPKAQAWLQVTDLSAQTTISSGKGLVWVNDVATHQPVGGASIALADGTVLGTTEGEGTALFDASALLAERVEAYGWKTIEAKHDLVISDGLGRRLYVPFGAWYYGSGEFEVYSYVRNSDLYWSYLYTDKPLYKPDDTLRFWGVVREREGEPKALDITVELEDGEYDGEFTRYGYKKAALTSLELKTTSLGTFSGEMKVSGLTPGWYYLKVRAGGESVAEEYIVVQTYTKPVFQIEVTPSRRAVFAGDVVDFDVEATFFEGSPVPNAALVISGPLSGELTTDANGHATFQWTATAPSSHPASQVIEVRTMNAEAGEIVGSAWVLVFESSLRIEAQGRYEGGNGIIEGQVNRILLDEVEPEDWYDWYEGDSPAAGQRVRVDVTEESYEATEIGQTYDFIQKIVTPLYSYRSIRNPIGTFEATTGSDGSFSVAFKAEEGKSYEAGLTVTDEGGRKTGSYSYVFAKASWYGGYPDASRPYLRLRGQDYCSQYFWGEDREGFRIGEQVEMEMSLGRESLPASGDNRYLFIEARNGIIDYLVQESSSLSFPFEEQHVPSVTIFAVWFTGETYVLAPEGCGIAFDAEEKRLQVEVTAGKERYEPGDEATLHVTTKDADGHPVSAEVNLNAVDEAIFRLQPQYYGQYEDDILKTLYTPVRYGLITSYSSHQIPQERWGGGGRGGDGGARQDFTDTALFQSVMTDENGEGSVTFKLPDNLTSWRVIAQGVTADLSAGQTKTLLPVGLPFFVDVSMSEEYLTSDKPTVRLRAYGSELAEGASVSFTVSSETLGLEPTSVEGIAFQRVEVPLPELKEGEHELLVEASSQELSDSLVRRFRVVESRLLKTEARFYELADGIEIEGSRSRRTEVVFSDHNRGRYFSILRELGWTWGDRVDQMLARNLSQSLLEEYFDLEEGWPAEFTPLTYQTPDGGISMLPYSDADLMLSARMAALAPDSFGRPALASYFTKIVDDRNETRERVIVALYGLAALSEPVLPYLERLGASPDLTWREQTYLGLAWLAAGDEERARATLRSLLEQYGEEKAPMVRLRVGTDQDDILEATSLAAIVAGGLGDPLAPALFDYTTNNYTKDVLVELEQISYLRSALPRLSGEAVRLAFNLDGERREESLERGQSLRLELMPGQLRELSPEALSGSVGVSSFFLAPFRPEEAMSDPDVKIERRFELAEPGPIYHEDSLVRIVLDWETTAQAVHGCYQVTDILPSGMAPIINVSAWDLPSIDRNLSYPYRIDGQRVSFCAWPFDEARPIVYYARVTGKGEYTAEPAVIQSMRSAQSLNLTPVERITIR